MEDGRERAGAGGGVVVIRVLRVLEYTYADAETAIADQKIWIEKIGPGQSPKRMTMVSRTFPMTVEPDPEPVEP